VALQRFVRDNDTLNINVYNNNNNNNNNNIEILTCLKIILTHHKKNKNEILTAASVTYYS